MNKDWAPWRYKHHTRCNMLSRLVDPVKSRNVNFGFEFKSNLDISTTHPKFDLAGIQTHEVWIMIEHCMPLRRSSSLPRHQSLCYLTKMYCSLYYPPLYYWYPHSVCGVCYFAFLATSQSHNNVTCGRGRCSTRVEIATRNIGDPTAKSVLKELQNISYLGELWTYFHNSFYFLFFIF